MLHVLIIGDGAVAAAHRRAYHGLHGFAADAALGPEPAVAAGHVLRTATGACKAALAAVCDRDAIGLVDVCAAAPWREVWLRAACELGLHCLSAGPPALQRRGLAGLARAAKQGRAALAVTQTRRFHPGFARVAELVGTGALGGVRTVHCTRTPGAGAGVGGGGDAVDALYADVDFCLWLLGGPATVTDRDAGRIDLAGPDGATARISISAAAAAGTERHAVQVGGTHGRVELAADSSGAARLTIELDGRTRALAVPAAVPLDSEIGYFAGSLVRGEPWVTSTLEDAAAAVACLG